MYAFIADTHIGVKLPNEDFLKSLNKFLGLIKGHHEECHAIFVAGDLFEHRLSIEEAQFASVFILNIVYNFCGKKGKTHVPVYFVHGTMSHDLDQYNIYFPILDKMPGARVFYAKHVCETELENGKRVLFLPHEYGDIDYKPFFDKEYDIIVGHGTLASNTRNPCKTTSGIVHSAEQLGSISKICVFGHYHGYTDFGNQVYYAGPWLQWKYGEDEKRVFFLCNDNFEVETHPNPYALEFKTIEVSSPEELRDIVAQEIKTPHRFIIQSTSADMETYRGIIMSTKYNSNLKYQLNEIVDEDDLQLTVDEVIMHDMSEHASQPIPSLITYIKDKYGIDATDQLADYESQINKEKKEG